MPRIKMNTRTTDITLDKKLIKFEADIKEKENEELLELKEKTEKYFVDRDETKGNIQHKEIYERKQKELHIIKSVLEKRTNSLIAKVEKETYYQTYRILVRHFPFCNNKIFEENKVANEPGFYPENDTDFRISLRGGELEDYYSVDEDELNEKLLKGEITPEEAGEAVATMYISKKINMLINCLKDNEVWEYSRYRIEEINN